MLNLQRWKNPKLFDELFGHYSPSLMREFRRWLDENPHIYKRFVQLSEQIKATGRPYYSSKMLVNVLRWETDLRQRRGEFKINDKYQSLLGRVLEWENARFRGFFKKRVRK